MSDSHILASSSNYQVDTYKPDPDDTESFVAVLVSSCQCLEAFKVFPGVQHSLRDNKTVSYLNREHELYTLQQLKGIHHASAFLKLKPFFTWSWSLGPGHQVW